MYHQQYASLSVAKAEYRLTEQSFSHFQSNDFLQIVMAHTNQHALVSPRWMSTNSSCSFESEVLDNFDLPHIYRARNTYDSAYLSRRTQRACALAIL